ncbi:MAG: hypothetical protein IJI74_00845 [Firmicutes bacterium]|nr:hypothetical protein [Bacillota bacterium]
MDIYREQMEKVKLEMMRLSDQCERELSILPKGNLTHRVRGDATYYLQGVHQDGKLIRRGINKEPELVAKLARKDYLIKTQNAVSKNLTLLNRMLMNYWPLDPESLLQQMSPAGKTVPVQQILQGMIDTDTNIDQRMKQHRKWAQANYQQNTFRPEDKKHLTSSGIWVRSKSEVLIAEKLFDYGIPFRYEQLIQIDGQWYAPDFTIQDREFALIYWEHAGMMDDPKYVRNHTLKMSKYQYAGIVPWKNLIVTYDKDDGGIDMEEINFYIRHIILKRL